MNVYLYWVGKEYKLISILRKLIYAHSKSGKGYEVILITDKNVNEYVKVPEYFDKLCPAHQADFVRVSVICDFGGIWLDSDTLIMHSLDSLFEILDTKDGFFMKQNNNYMFNGVFGSNKNTPLMVKWKNTMIDILDKNYNIEWCTIGNDLLETMYHSTPKLYENYIIFNGLDNLYPVVWNNCVTEFIDKPYDNYKKIIRDYQPLIVLVNSVYKKLENLSIQEILARNIPLNYFIKKSISNLNPIDRNILSEYNV